MNFRNCSFFALCSFLLSCVLIASCLATETRFSDTDALVDNTGPESLAIQVPLSESPELDGNLGSDEWAQALRLDMTHGGTVFLQHDGQFLYVGISAEGLGYGHVCWQREDQVWILHSSAALGSAAYQLGESGGRLIWDYNWCCRSTISTVERQALFEREGWMASIGYLGAPNQMEYQIAWDGQIRLAVIYQQGDTANTAFVWPPSLSDDCLNLATGASELIDPANFDFESWGVLDETES